MAGGLFAADGGGVVAQVVERPRDIAVGGRGQGLAAVAGLRFGELRDPFRDGIGDGDQELGAFGHAKSGCGLGGCHREVYIGSGAARDGTEDLAGLRIHVIQVLALRRCDGLAADPMFESFHYR